MIKHTRPMAFILALIFIFGCANSDSRQTSIEPLSRQEVVTFIDQWVTAEATADFENLAPLVHPQALYRSNDGDHEGIDAIRQSFESTFASSPEQNYTIHNIRIKLVAPHTAFAVYSWTWNGKTPDGRGFTVTGRGTKVMARDEQGLKLRLLHLNQDTAVLDEA